jgi:FkbM family methyltransferase
MLSIIAPALRVVTRCRWIRRGLRDRLGRLICDPEAGTSHPFVVPFFGYRYRGNLSSYIDWNVYFFGAYERELLLLISGIVRGAPGAVAFDIGANVGHHALAMARWASTVHAFEPYPTVARELIGRTVDNPEANIIVHRFGLGVTDEHMDYFAPTGRGNLGTGSFVAEHAPGYNAHHGKLPIRNGDAVVAELKLARLDFIKLDVEGFESDVLLGLRDTLERHRPTILMEWSAETRRAFGSIGNLRNALPTGYRIDSVVTDRPFAIVFNRQRYRLVSFEFDAVPSYLLMQPQAPTSH